MDTDYDWSNAKVGDQVWMKPGPYEKGWWGVIAEVTYPDDTKEKGRAMVAHVDGETDRVTYVSVP
jgi:hypothetical protein